MKMIKQPTIPPMPKRPTFDARDTQYNLPIGTDCISRQAAIDAFNTNIDELVVSGKENADAVERYLNRVIDEIKQLPPIQPKRGKWERHYSRPNVYADLFWHCSECGYKDIENYAPVYHHFCPNCGAKMEVTT